MLPEGKLILSSVPLLFHKKQMKNPYNLKKELKINFLCVIKYLSANDKVLCANDLT